MSAALQRPAVAERIKLPEHGDRVARHVPRRDTIGDPGKLRSRPEVAPHLSRSCSGRRALAKLCQTLGQHWPNVGQHCPTNGQTCQRWPCSTNVGICWPSVLQMWPESGQVWPTFANVGPVLHRSRPMLAIVCECWPKFGQGLTKFGQISSPGENSVGAPSGQHRSSPASPVITFQGAWRATLPGRLILAATTGLYRGRSPPSCTQRGLLSRRHHPWPPRLRRLGRGPRLRRAGGRRRGGRDVVAVPRAQGLRRHLGVS